MRSATADAPSPSFQTTSPVEPLLVFQPLSVSDVVTTVRALPDKSCSLDVMPTRLLKAVIDTIAPFITELFHRSLSSGRVPEMFKAAYVTPRIKMDPTDPRSYRPISNLPVSSKLLERQLLAYFITSGLLPRLQSAYRSHHSTETAILKVLSDILLAIDAGDLSALVLLDLSAAFETVEFFVG